MPDGQKSLLNFSLYFNGLITGLVLALDTIIKKKKVHDPIPDLG